MWYRPLLLFVLKIEDDERERELNPWQAEDVPCPGKAQDVVFDLMSFIDHFAKLGVPGFWHLKKVCPINIKPGKIFFLPKLKVSPPRKALFWMTKFTF